MHRRKFRAGSASETLMAAQLVALLLAALGGLHPAKAVAGGGPLGIDYRLTYDNAGIWQRSNQLILLNTMIGAVK